MLDALILRPLTEATLPKLKRGERINQSSMARTCEAVILNELNLIADFENFNIQQFSDE